MIKNNRTLWDAILDPFERKSMKYIKKIINNGSSDINSHTVSGDSLLHHAITSGDYEIIELLIKNGADVNYVGARGFTPLHWAIFEERSSLRIIELLIEGGANLNQPSHIDYIIGGETPLMMACGTQARLDIVKLLVKSGADVNFANARGTTALHHACMSGKFDIVKFLIENGADIDCNDEGAYLKMGGSIGYTPLYYAKRNGHKWVARLLRHAKKIKKIQVNKKP